MKDPDAPEASGRGNLHLLDSHSGTNIWKLDGEEHTHVLKELTTRLTGKQAHTHIEYAPVTHRLQVRLIPPWVISCMSSNVSRHSTLSLSQKRKWPQIHL